MTGLEQVENITKLLVMTRYVLLLLDDHIMMRGDFDNKNTVHFSLFYFNRNFSLMRILQIF